MNKKLVAVVFGVVGCVACLLIDISSSPGQRLEKFEPAVMTESISQPAQVIANHSNQRLLTREQGNTTSSQNDAKPAGINELLVNYYRFLYMTIATVCAAFPLTITFVVVAMIAEAFRVSRGWSHHDAQQVS